MGARVLALPQPEERGPHDLGLRAGPHDPDQRGDALVRRTLGQGEHRLLPHLELAPAVPHDRIEPARGLPPAACPSQKTACRACPPGPGLRASSRSVGQTTRAVGHGGGGDQILGILSRRGPRDREGPSPPPGAETRPRSTAPVPDFQRPPTWVSAEVRGRRASGARPARVPARSRSPNRRPSSSRLTDGDAAASFAADLRAGRRSSDGWGPRRPPGPARPAIAPRAIPGAGAAARATARTMRGRRMRQGDSMMSCSALAARGSSLCPSQNSAFLRSSVSGSLRATRAAGRPRPDRPAARGRRGAAP